MPTKQNIYKAADYWSRKARDEGYPARSVYKLKEIAEKFALLKDCRRVLDLGASPGSWTSWLLKNIPDGGRVVSVDLNPLSSDIASGNLVFIKGDMCESAIQDAVMREAPFDAVVSDAAPATTGSRTVDTLRSAALVETALWYAGHALNEGGFFCAKIFQGGKEASLLAVMRSMFAKSRFFRPAACRKESFETYLIGLNKRGTGNGQNRV